MKKTPEQVCHYSGGRRDDVYTSRKSRTQTHSAEHSSQFVVKGAANPRIHRAGISKYLAFCCRMTEGIKGL